MVPGGSWKILLIEDDEDDYILTHSLLREAKGAQVSLVWKSTYQDGLEALAKDTYDAILVDYHLGGRDGLELMREAVAGGCTTPFILLTGQGNYLVDVQAGQTGFSDYIVKSEANASMLERSIRYAIEHQRLIAENKEARRQAEASAAEAHRRAAEAEEGKRILDAIMENIPEGLVIADVPDAHVHHVSRYGQQMIGEPEAALINVSLADLAKRLKLTLPNGNALPGVEAYPLARAVMKGEIIENEELVLISQDGKQAPILCNAAPIRDANGEITGGILSWRDISDLKQAEAGMRERAAHIEAQRYLAQYRENERLKVARDLHDGPIQDLIAITFALQEAIDESPESALAELLGTIQTRVQNQVRELRDFCNELRPPTLAPFGLEKAIRAHVEGFAEQHPGISIQLDLQPDGQQLPQDVRLALFRICQELLNNIVRHSHATQAAIRFSLEKGRIFFQVSDNGSGFTPPDEWVALARQGHLGLVGIFERAEAVGGAIQVTSRPGQGTCVQVTIPFAPAKS